MICHGRGTMPGNNAETAFNDGCCFIDGEICPNRWFIDYSTSTPAGDTGTATIRNSEGVSLGTVTAYVTSLMPGGGNTKAQRVARVVAQLTNILYVCAPAAYVIGMDPSLITNRVQFETAWSGRAEYTPIADYWQSIGKPRNWCMSFGPTEGQCCHAEDQATNDANRAFLHTSAVEVRRRAPGAS
jgi:hypothetical protein